MMKNFHSAVEKVSTRSVLNPILWLCGIVVPCGLGAAFYLSGPLAIVSIGLVAMTITFTLFMYAFFAVKDPQRLQSEDYNLQRQAIQAFGDKDHPREQFPESKSELSANPNLPKIEEESVENG